MVGEWGIERELRMRKVIWLLVALMCVIIVGCFRVCSVSGRSSRAALYCSVSAMEPLYNTEQYDEIEEPGFKLTMEKPLSTFSIDVDTASYANMRRFIRKLGSPRMRRMNIANRNITR